MDIFFYFLYKSLFLFTQITQRIFFCLPVLLILPKYVFGLVILGQFFQVHNVHFQYVISNICFLFKEKFIESYFQYLIYSLACLVFFGSSYYTCYFLRLFLCLSHCLANPICHSLHFFFFKKIPFPLLFCLRHYLFCLFMPLFLLAQSFLKLGVVLLFLILSHLLSPHF